MSRTPTRRAYILLMTLILLAIAGTAMVGMTQRSLGRAVESLAAQEQLQRRWSMLSCQAAVLRCADRILEQHEQETEQPAANLRTELRMGQCRVLLVLSDEQAKANVNTLYRLHGDRQLEHSLRSLLRASDAGLKLQLRPFVDGKTANQEPPFGSLGQVFDAPAPEQLLVTDASAAGGAAITCWGSGRLRFHRASREAIAEICQPLLTTLEVNQLLAARRDTPAMPLDRILGRLQLSSDKRGQLQARLTDQSFCYSLWIGVVTPARACYRLDVRTTDDRKLEQFVTFSW